ncbi:MAG: hypothetical protein HY549_01530 [Elusimicrobia bacterium]|nr:hypothetical protein [Elusimicrobiota bacterium]
MERYQLRIKADQSLESVLDELVEAVWHAIPTEVGLKENEKVSLRTGLKKVFSRFIVRYDTCGLQSICEEALVPSEWNHVPKPELWPRHPWQSEEIKRLVLTVEKRLEEFVNALEAEIFKDVFATPARAPLARELRTQLGEAIQKSIGPYLYRSVVCGMSELCKEATQVDPWKQ